jgi:methionine-rich copper-binding protein CopC
MESGDETDALKIELTDPATEFTVALPALAPGDHLVRWRALSADTHVVSGEIRFTIAD